MPRLELQVTGSGAADLVGKTILSDSAARVEYHVSRLLGEGGTGSAYLAARGAPDGVALVVIKTLHPDFVVQAGPTANLIVEKEYTALSRLNDRVPPTAFVVRMIDAGVIPARYLGRELDYPWLCIEYVHGGAEGTTLLDRVDYSLRHMGAAFDPARAAHAVECIGSGLGAVHDVGVVHRDLTPNNILCCGFGDQEIFKIVDFGIARPAGVAATFGGILLGTPGYAPPEQAALDESRTGTWSDVFAYGCLIYYLLTGEHYFDVPNPMEGLRVVASPERRSIRDAKGLHEELRTRQRACDAIDRALAGATAVRAKERFQTADVLFQAVVPWLRADSRRIHPSVQRLESVVRADEATIMSGWDWSIRHEPKDGVIVRSVSWDGDGHCLAATSRGLAFWNGTAWLDVSTKELPHPTGIRFVQKMRPGRWLVGGDDATLAVCSADGVTDVVHGYERDESFVHAGGDMDDIAVFVGTQPDKPPKLYGMVARRWLRAVSLKPAQSVTGIARISDERWLVVGRRTDGRGYALIYEPLNWLTLPLAVPHVRSLTACAGGPDRQIALAAGADGLVVWIEKGEVRSTVVEGKPDLSASAVDLANRGWVAGVGRIWLGSTRARRTFRPVWEDRRIEAPVVSLFVDVGVTIAMTANLAVIEGRSVSEFLGMSKDQSRGEAERER